MHHHMGARLAWPGQSIDIGINIHIGTTFKSIWYASSCNMLRKQQRNTRRFCSNSAPNWFVAALVLIARPRIDRARALAGARDRVVTVEEGVINMVVWTWTNCNCIQWLRWLLMSRMWGTRVTSGRFTETYTHMWQQAGVEKWGGVKATALQLWSTCSNASKAHKFLMMIYCSWRW